MNEIRELFERLRRAPFPALGKRVGDFPLCDSLLAGCAARASRGEMLLASEIPAFDDATTRFVVELRQKPSMSEEERAFLHYFHLLEDIRMALLGQRGQ